jgi:cytochrome b
MPIKVWDLPVRVLHVALIAAVTAAWVTSEVKVKWHEAVGVAALAVVLLRLVWGVAGGRYARFAQFVRGPRATLAYALAVLRGQAPRHLGHNPLGGWMVVLLLAWVAAAGITGWLCTTERYWGDETLGLLHEVFAWGLLGAVVLHVLGVLTMSRKHRENLVVAMLHGRKREPRGGDVS